MITRLLGKRIAAVYLLSVSVCALLLGAFAGNLYVQHGIDLRAVAAASMSSPISLVTVVSALLLLALLVQSAHRIDLAGQSAARIRRLCNPLGFDPTGRSGRAGAIMLAILCYLSTALDRRRSR